MATHDLEPTSSNIDPPPSPIVLSSSWLDELHRDDISYTYASTWSSNYTMSNLEGPGRIIGNFLSSAGSSLERILGALAYRVGAGDYATAKTDLLDPCLNSMLLFGDISKREEACALLLGYASSNSSTIQILAFAKLIRNAIHFPSFRSSIETFCQNRNELVETLVFSWKRPGVEYSHVWLYFYNVASRCLSRSSSPVMDAISNFVEPVYSCSLDLSSIGTIISCCRDVCDASLAIEYIAERWNGSGLREYLERQGGLDDPIFQKLEIAIRTRYEVLVLAHSAHIELRPFVRVSPWCVSGFLLGMWTSAQALGSKKSDIFLEDARQLEIWTEVFKLYWIVHSQPGKEAIPLMTQYIHAKGHGKTWKEVCMEEFPKPEFTKLREQLMRLEDIYGSSLSERFPQPHRVALVEH